MAKQKGLIKLKGTIGDITFYKSKDGYIAKEKTGIEGSRIATDPAFQRTRENGAEFGRAGKAGKVLRSSIRSFIQKASDSRMGSRLLKEMMRVVHSDQTSVRGARNVVDGDCSLLTGFDFNVQAKLGATLFAPYTATINRATGVCTITLPPFVPADMVSAPSGTTHYNIFATAAEVDFVSEAFENAWEETAPLPWNQVPTAITTLVNNLPALSTKPLFLAMGIEFLQEVNGNLYSLKNGAHNAMALVKVDVE